MGGKAMVSKSLITKKEGRRSLQASSSFSSSSSHSSSTPTLTSSHHGTKVSLQLPSIPASFTSSSLPTSISVTYCTSLLPSLNPHLTQAMISSELLKERKKELQAIIHERNISIDGKHELWRMLEDVKTHAGQYREPLKGRGREGEKQTKRLSRVSSSSQGGEDAGESEGEVVPTTITTPPSSSTAVKTHKQGKRKSSKEVPVTAIALQRRSAELSRKAQLNPIIRGVSSSASSPFLLSSPSDQRTNSHTTPLPLHAPSSSSASATPLLAPTRTAIIPTGESSRGMKTNHKQKKTRPPEHHHHQRQQQQRSLSPSTSLSQMLSLSLSSSQQLSSTSQSENSPKRVIRILQHD
jgi:hypothetical protein